MSVPMRSVFSSHVERIGYDVARRELFVEWDTGKMSAYSDVPENVADEVMRSWSVGSALTMRIKGSYPHRYVTHAG